MNNRPIIAATTLARAKIFAADILKLKEREYRFVSEEDQIRGLSDTTIYILLPDDGCDKMAHLARRAQVQRLDLRLV